MDSAILPAATAVQFVTASKRVGGVSVGYEIPFGPSLPRSPCHALASVHGWQTRSMNTVSFLSCVTV